MAFSTTSKSEFKKGLFVGLGVMTGLVIFGLAAGVIKAAV